MLVNQGVSAPWSSPFLGFDSMLHTAGFRSFHSPTLLSGFVGEFRVSLGSSEFRWRVSLSEETNGIIIGSSY